jgi:hypothetical protein
MSYSRQDAGPNLNDRSSLFELLSRARRRCFAHLLLDQSALAVTIGMGGAVVLLLAGTQILDWYWVALLAVASLGTGLYRLRKTIPSTYALAQRMDRRLSLADALSTATYFSSSEARGDEAIRERQRQEAESIARTVDVNQGVPFKRPRYIFPAVGLAMVAFGLFALRYAVTGSLSLQPSLVRIAFDTFFASKPEMAKANQNKKPSDIKPPAMDPGSPDAPTTQNDMAPDSVLDTVDVPDVNNPQATDQSKSAAKEGSQTDPANDQQGENQDKGDKSAQGNDASQDGPQGDKSKDGKQNAKQDSKQGSANENSSLMDKLRDAMANMMNKMKPQKDGQQSPQNSQNGQGQQNKSNQQKGQQAQNKSQSADADAQNDQNQNDGDKKQSAEARGNEKSTDKNASQDSKSGIGSSDGDKSAREAEQLAAMGKISEIIGKRAANVSGEVMVEVGSSKQQLKTPWAQRQAAHSEAGSEIHRDEVPLMYQQFVQQYFEEIRKTAPAPVKK